MHITRSQFKRIRHLLPKPRGSRLISYYRFFNAQAYMGPVTGANGGRCPLTLSPWHTVYMLLYRWGHSGVLAQVLNHLQQERLSQWAVQTLSLDSTIVKVHPDDYGAQKKTDRKP
jgi:hypothetical protein